MKRLFQSTLLLLTMLVSSTMMRAADVTYSPVLDVNFRTAAGNTSWQTVKNAADEGNNNFELNLTNGFFALQKYTVADLQDATKLVLTLTVGNRSGVDAVRVWAFTDNTWTATSGIDDIVPLVTAQTGIEPRGTGTANTPLVTGAKVTGSDPAKATFTISGTALSTIKANASSDGTFTLLLTNNDLTNSNNNRSYLSNNTANDEANRPTLVATIETPSVKNITTGVTYGTLTEAFNAAVSAGTDAELEVYDDQTLTGRLTWNKGTTLTITPKKDITIKGHRNGMWFLANVNNGRLNLGSSDYTITLDGQSNTFEYDVTKYENSATIALTNVVFQNFNLNNVGHLVGSKANEGQIILDRVTFKNCSNPAAAFIDKERVTNDRVVLKGWLNQESCTGTTIYAASETKSSGTTGRIKVDDADFTASAPITINWPGTKEDGIVVVIGTSAANASSFQLTDSEWSLERKQNGDLVMAKPVEPTAMIGTTGYVDLAAALAAVQDGETITLLADQEVSSRINVKNQSITIDGQGQYAIKRASSYANGLLFLTQKPDEGMTTALTLQDIVLDGSAVETTAALIEAGNNGTTVLNSVTIQNVTTTQNAVIVNKGGGKLTLNGVTFTNCTAAKADVFQGNSVTLAGANSIGSIYVEKQLVLTVLDGSTVEAPIALLTDDNRQCGLIVNGTDASLFTSESFRLSQQVDGIYAMPLSVAGNFTHPGLLHTAADIERVKANLSVEPFKSAYAQLESTSAATPAGASEILKRMDQANWAETYADYGNFSHAAKDAQLAYQLALRYQLKGSNAAANAAVAILNDWATNCKGVLRISGKNYTNNSPDPNEYLLCIQAYQFANAAELLRDYTGWQAADFIKFKEWMRSTFADLAYQFLENHHGNENALHYWLNWDLAALTAMYSVGVLCDDQSLVDYALNYTTNGTGTGNVANAIIATAQDPDSQETLAQCQESGRDQGHATLDVTLLGAFCQMAQSQGTDLFTPYKALEMAEYVAKYNLKNDAGAFAYTEADLPFTAYNYNEGEHTAISSDARGTVRPSYELFNAYAVKNDKAGRYVQQMSEWARRQNAYGEATNSSTDELGFGTLMYMSADVADYGYVLNVTDAGVATMMLPFDATIPENVKVWTVNYTVGDANAKATEVQTTIPANTPVLVEATEGTYTFTAETIWQAAVSDVSSSDNALTGVFSKTIVPTGAYILTNTDEGLGFRLVDGTTNFVEANRAYFSVDGATAARIGIDFGGETTAVLSVALATQQTEQVYNLQGQRVDQPRHGLYIINGKKVIVK